MQGQKGLSVDSPLWRTELTFRLCSSTEAIELEQAGGRPAPFEHMLLLGKKGHVGPALGLCERIALLSGPLFLIRALPIQLARDSTN